MLRTAAEGSDRMSWHNARAASSLSAILLSASVAHAQDGTTALYGDWTLSCANSPTSGASKSCGLVQVQKISGQSAAISQIGIGRVAKNDPFRISVMIGADAWLPSGVRLVTNDNAPAITASFKWCTSTGCLADFDLSDADIGALRVQKDPANLVYKTASKVDVSIPVSFRGFNEAFEVLQKE
jgi:invasion protein IalB